jgi:hypothetical protein
MANLVENIVSLENEADSIVAQAQAEGKEIEQSAIGEVEAYRRQLAEETEQKISAFQREAEKKHQRSAAEIEKELAQALNAVDQIEGAALKQQIDKIVSKFGEL